MAYLPGTMLSCDKFIPDIDGTDNRACVLSDNEVVCLTGVYKGDQMKLIDWLILAQGHEKVIMSHPYQEAYWANLLKKAGLDATKYIPDSPYGILGVPETATFAEVQAVYTRLSNAAHPEKPGGSAQEFQRLSRAYREIQDKELLRPSSRAPLTAEEREAIAQHNLNYAAARWSKAQMEVYGDSYAGHN
jgi:hypothetical protein